MPDDDINRARMAQFIAQDRHGRPHTPCLTSAIDLVIRRPGPGLGSLTEGERPDPAPQGAGGLIRAAGDLAVENGDALIEERHVLAAQRRSRTAEERSVNATGRT